MKLKIEPGYFLSPDNEPRRTAEGAASINYLALLDQILPPVPPVLITKVWLKEIETMKNTWQVQLQNVAAVHSFLQKQLRTGKANARVPGAADLLEKPGQGYSFTLPGSSTAFGLFAATLFRKSYWFNNRAQVNPATNTLKLFLDLSELAVLEQELSILLEALTSTDYVATLLQWQIRQRKLVKQHQMQKMAG